MKAFAARDGSDTKTLCYGLTSPTLKNKYMKARMRGF